MAVANEPSSVRRSMRLIAASAMIRKIITLTGAGMLFPFGTQAEIASRDPSRTSDVAVHRKQQSGDEANKRAREVDQ